MFYSANAIDGPPYWSQGLGNSVDFKNLHSHVFFYVTSI